MPGWSAAAAAGTASRHVTDLLVCYKRDSHLPSRPRRHRLEAGPSPGATGCLPDSGRRRRYLRGSGQGQQGLMDDDRGIRVPGEVCLQNRDVLPAVRGDRRGRRGTRGQRRVRARGDDRFTSPSPRSLGASHCAIRVVLPNPVGAQTRTSRGIAAGSARRRPASRGRARSRRRIAGPCSLVPRTGIQPS